MASGLRHHTACQYCYFLRTDVPGKMIVKVSLLLIQKILTTFFSNATIKPNTKMFVIIKR